MSQEQQRAYKDVGPRMFNVAEGFVLIWKTSSQQASLCTQVSGGVMAFASISVYLPHKSPE